MKLKSYTAPTVKAAMDKIKQELGSDAIIISTKKETNGGVRVTAAKERPEDADIVPIKSTPKSKLAAQLVELFKFHKIPAEIAGLLINQAEKSKAKNIADVLTEVFAATYKFNPLKFNQQKPLMVVGMPGIGKTLSLSKMATEATFYDRKVNVITTDIKRAGGVEQLGAFTKILGIHLVVARSPQELKKAIAAAPNNITLIDSAGANPYDEAELDSLRNLLESISVEPLFVIPAGGDVEEAIDMANAFRFTGAKRMLITKADSARRFGSIFAAVHENNLAFSNFSGTPNVGKGLTPITPESLSALVLKPFK